MMDLSSTDRTWTCFRKVDELNHPPIILIRIDQNLPFSAVTCQDFLR